MLNLAVTWVFVIPVITPTQLGRYLGIYIYIYNTSKLPVLDSAVTSWVYIEYRQLPILNSAVTWVQIHGFLVYRLSGTRLRGRHQKQGGTPCEFGMSQARTMTPSIIVVDYILILWPEM